MKIINKIVLVLTLVFFLPTLSYAAPYANSSGIVVDDSLPAGFTSGYEYASNYDIYNTPASENGLEGKYIWLEGTFNSLDKIELDIGKDTITIITDINGKQWVALLDLEAWTGDAVFTNLFNKPLAFAVRYGGLSGKYNLPVVYCVKICDITTRSVWNSVYAPYSFTDIPAIDLSVFSGRYYNSDDLKQYRPYVFCDVVVSGTSLTYVHNIADITTSPQTATRAASKDVSKMYAFYNSKENLYIYVGDHLLLVTSPVDYSTVKYVQP